MASSLHPRSGSSLCQPPQTSQRISSPRSSSIARLQVPEAIAHSVRGAERWGASWREAEGFWEFERSVLGGLIPPQFCPAPPTYVGSVPAFSALHPHIYRQRGIEAELNFRGSGPQARIPHVERIGARRPTAPWVGADGRVASSRTRPRWKALPTFCGGSGALPRASAQARRRPAATPRFAWANRAKHAVRRMCRLHPSPEAWVQDASEPSRTASPASPSISVISFLRQKFARIFLDGPPSLVRFTMESPCVVQY